jgi:hypothetical protein
LGQKTAPVHEFFLENIPQAASSTGSSVRKPAAWNMLAYFDRVEHQQALDRPLQAFRGHIDRLVHALSPELLNRVNKLCFIRGLL